MLSYIGRLSSLEDAIFKAVIPSAYKFPELLRNLAGTIDGAMPELLTDYCRSYCGAITGATSPTKLDWWLF
jgi:hypothetical protein